MPVDKFYTVFASDNSLRSYDFGTGLWSTLLSSVVTAGAATPGNGVGAWDGTYYYFTGGDASNKLYRYDPAGNTISTMGGGGNIDSSGHPRWLGYTNRGGNNLIYWVNSAGARYGYYNITSNTFSAFNTPATTQYSPVWDRGQYIYFVCLDNTGNRCLRRLDLDTNTFTSLAQPPLGSRACNGNEGSVINTNGDLFHYYSAFGQVYKYVVGTDTWSLIGGGLGTASQSTQGIVIVGDLDRFIWGRFDGYKTVSNTTFSLSNTGTPVSTPMAIAYTDNVVAAPPSFNVNNSSMLLLF